MPRLKNTTATFLLTILMIGLCAGATVVAQEGTPIVAGDTMSGTLTDDVSSFNYDLTPSDSAVLLTATSDEFTPTLGLAYASGEGGSISVSFDGDVGNPLFIPPLAEGANAQLQVTSNRFPAEGTFTLTATAVDAPPVSANEAVAGTIDADGAPGYFSFQAELGKLVTVTAQGGAFDTRLQLFTPGSIRSTAADNDGGVGYDPEIYQAVLTGGGTGYIEVAPAFAGESGSFTLSLAVSDPPTLDENSSVLIRLGGSRGTGALMFSGVAGGKAEVTVRSVGGDTEDAIIAMYQDGVRLIWDDRFDPASSGGYQMDTQTDSPVYIIVTADTAFDEANEGQFEVSLKRL